MLSEYTIKIIINQLLVKIKTAINYNLPITVAARSKAWVYGRSLARIAGLNPAGSMDVCLLRVLCVV
jgi:hypothetical protein